MIPARYRLVLPAPPDHWAAVLGEPAWDLTWLGPGGRLESAAVPPGGPAPEAALDQERPGMVLAWPSWPERGLPRGRMRPAGAVFPYDASGDALTLSWEAGPEAQFFLYLAAQTSRGEAAPAKNRAWTFNWPRFRELLRGPSVPPEIQADPWLAPWRSIAERTIQSGFDSRRIKVPEGRKTLSITLPAEGPWFGASPFIPAYPWRAGETVQIEAGEEAETLVSPMGQIRYGGGLWMRID